MSEGIAISDTAFGAPKIMPLTIEILGAGVLQPQDDITPLESAHIAMLLCGASWSGRIGQHFVDCAGFIKEHALERHFKP
jgi:hypothetical protein